MKKVTFAVLVGVFCLFCASNLFAQQSELPRLAITGFSVNDTYNKKLENDALLVCNKVESNIINLERYDVMIHSETSQLLEKLHIPLASISAKNNLEKIKSENIDYVLTGTIDASDYDYLVTLRILDVSKGRFIHSDDEFMNSSASDINRGIKTLVNRFMESLKKSDGYTNPVTKSSIANVIEHDFVLVEGLESGDYYICKHEVTQKEYLEVIGKNPSFFNDNKNSNNPVDRVSWYDAIEYCNKRSIQEGLRPCYTLDGKVNPDEWGRKCAVWDSVKCNFNADGYRLPTESEWDFAANGGQQNNAFRFSGNNEIEDIAWYYDNSHGSTHEVMTKAPNELGIFDMSGNVWEWCWNWYTTGSCRVFKGGAWNGRAYYCGVSYRNFYSPNSACYSDGFRVVRSYSEYKLPKQSGYAM